MNKNKIIPLFAALAVVGLLGGSLVAAYPGWRGEDSLLWGDEEALQKAIEDKDYEAWKTLMVSKLTEERFNEIVDRRSTMLEKRASVEAAFDAEDYDAWVEAMSMNGKAHPLVSQIKEDEFPTLIELHKARQDGDRERVKTLTEELGFPHVSDKAMAYGMGHKHGRQFSNRL